MNKRSRACQFSRPIIEKIDKRDKDCLFCRLHYHMEKALPCDLSIFDTMHIVNKSHGGLGVEQNGIKGCRYHHHMLDNSEYNQEMREICREYLRSLYPGWTEESVTYNKYKDLVVYRK